MKRFILASLALCCACALAADNDQGAPKYQSGSPNQIQIRTTDTAGVHVPHVIVDSGAVSATTATTVKSTALEASHVLLAAPGNLVSLHVFNSKASAQYILVLNSATVTGDGAVVLLYPPINIPAGGNASLTFPTPLAASIGISVSNSSTGSFTKTVGSADCVFTAQVQ